MNTLQIDFRHPFPISADGLADPPAQMPFFYGKMDVEGKEVL